MLVYLKPHFVLESSIIKNKSEKKKHRNRIFPNKNTSKTSKTTCFSIEDDSQFFNLNIKKEDSNFKSYRIKKIRQKNNRGSRLSKIYFNNNSVFISIEEECGELYTKRRQKCNEIFSIQKIFKQILGIDILSAYGEIT